MNIDLSGIIKTSKRPLKVKGQECFGTTTAKGQKFSILLSEKENRDPIQLIETLLHELLHLYFFIIIGITNRRISEEKQHEVIEASVPFILNKIAITLAAKRKL